MNLSFGRLRVKSKIDEPTLANADLDNLLQSADLAMIVLDRNKRIRHVIDAARKLMLLLRSDEGRSLAEFNIPIGNFNLLDKIGEVIETGDPFVETTQPNDKDQSFYLRITPYFFADGSVEGAILSLIDISKEMDLRHDLSVETEKLQLAMKAAVLDFRPLESREGFGSLLIASGVRQLRGTFDRSYGENGARIALTLALSPAEEG